MNLFLSFFIFLSYLGNPELSDVRKIYPNAANSEIIANELASKLFEITNENNKVLVAYKGASMTLLAKFNKKVSDKIKNARGGIKLIEYAILNEPNNAEIHLIRLSVQENAPKILNYHNNKKEDVDFLLNHYKEQSNSLAAYIKSFILQSKSFSKQEKQSIE